MYIVCLAMSRFILTNTLHVHQTLLHNGAMKIMIGIRATKEFREFLMKMADQENRTLSNFITNALLTYIKEHKGIDWKKEPVDK